MVYDIFRIGRKLFKMADGIVFICDAVFWVVCTVIAFHAVMYSNYGELRWFVFAGIAIGGVVYFVLLSKIVTKTFLFLLRIVVRICLFVKKVALFIDKLFARPRRFVRSKAGLCVRYTRCIIKKYRFIKKLRKIKS